MDNLQLQIHDNRLQVEVSVLNIHWIRQMSQAHQMYRSPTDGRLVAMNLRAGCLLCEPCVEQFVDLTKTCKSQNDFNVLPALLGGLVCTNKSNFTVWIAQIIHKSSSNFTFAMLDVV